VLLCSFACGVEPFLPPLEEPVICELCVWELLCSICVDAKSAPHAKHTASRKEVLNTCDES
jgi:hypothetical protein